MKRYLAALLGFGLWAAPALAQTPQASPSPKPEEETVKLREEIVVVSASKTETQLVNAPATISVISADTIESSPAQNYGDLLRSVPGLNVIQTSARDINIVSRQAASTLVNSQLVLLDGRSLYLDFFGLVLWDFLPQSPSEIKQIEVVRGPASVVWGANALTGVVNVITKTPRDIEGLGVNLSAGLLNRSGGSREDDGTGVQYGGNFTFAQAPSERLAWRISAGYFNSDPYSRPVGVVGGCAPGVMCVPNPFDPTILTGGGIYPPDRSDIQGAFQNRGTSQPKVDLRVDQDFSNGARMTYQGGYGGSTGIIHTGLGPFDIQSPSYTAYGKLAYSKNALKVAAFGNFTDVEAPNLLLLDPSTLEPLQLNFKTQTYDLEVGNSNVLGGKHILSYGGNIRQNNFDITITPLAENRTEGGVYFQEEFFLEKFRLAVGARADKLGSIEDWKFSPRVSVMFKPAASQSVRFSYNRAFRAPSVINNFLDLPISSGNIVNLQPLAPFLPPALRPLLPPPFNLTVRGAGSEVVTPQYDMVPERLDAFEVAYTGTIGGRTTLGLAVYQNDTDDNINFTQLTPSAQFPTGLPGLSFYSPSNPATGISVPAGQLVTVNPLIMGVLPQIPPPFGPIRLPHTAFTYLNLGPIRNRGIEASVEHSFSNEVSASLNYSYQDDPEILDPESGQLRYPNAEVGLPPTNRFNAAINYNGRKFLGNVSVNYADEAFWVDVLDARYFGATDSYTMLNATVGVKLSDGKVVASLKGTNLLNEEIQQHVFGDILKLSLLAELRFFFK
jgi:outer membrane receptor protein involved in Fe transport